MGAARAATVSFGGLRDLTGPAGIGTARNRIDSSVLAASRCCNHCCNSARTATAPASPTQAIATSLRENVNRHLLRADVVRHVFRSDGQLVLAGSQVRRHDQFSVIRACLLVPTKVHWQRSVHAG